MIKNVLSDIGGIAIYGVISICLFFAVFIGALIWSLLLKKADLDSRSMLPLEDDTIDPLWKGDSNHE